MRQEIMTAADLPQEWDGLAGDNIYLTREFLGFLERTEKAGQRYHVFYDESGALDSILVCFKKNKYNLFMFTRLRVALDITMFYFPLSVSRPSFVIGENTRLEVAAFVKSVRGYKILLNAEESLNLGEFAKGLTCPRCVLDIKWKSFGEYLRALRSGYRYRYNKALRRSSSLTCEVLADNSLFDERLYSLYSEVYDNSRTKLEKLSIEFFRDPRFKILVLRDNSGMAVGFVQLLANSSQLIFEFVGFDHSLNAEYDIYIRLLLELVREGIEGEYKSIDLGQTADDAKLKLGARYTYLYALLHHSNRIVNAICKKLAKKIEYRPLNESGFHIFKCTDEQIRSVVCNEDIIIKA